MSSDFWLKTGFSSALTVWLLFLSRHLEVRQLSPVIGQDPARVSGVTCASSGVSGVSGVSGISGVSDRGG